MKYLLFNILLLAASLSAHAQQLAFPGAQGWGRFATGGRGGSVYHVTNLNDSGSGSLRDAVSQPNRIIVFDVAGVIHIQSRMVFKNNLYVAGQTAPGEGITVYGNGVSFSGATNIIVRYMRFRMGMGGDSGKDCAGIANGTNMIFDHCSFAWGRDETFSINPDGKGTTPQDITLQYSVVGQGLMDHSAGGLMQADHVSLIGNLLCDNATRNFKIKGTNQYANNIVYNWKNGAYIMGGDSEGKSYVNIQSNLFINGPAVGGAAFTGGNSDFHCYADDNWQDSNRDGNFNPQVVTDYNAATREPQPYDYPTLQLLDGRTLLDTNLPTVGASLPYRDYTDCYMASEVLSYGKRGALISNENSLPYGIPTTWNVWKGQKPADADGDGMPDEWEQQNGTNPAANDAMTIASNGYANIENYINGINLDSRQYFLRPPLLLTLQASTPTSMTLSWTDYTDNEQGFSVEMEQDGAFHEVVRTAANVEQCTINHGLTPATTYKVRVLAFDGDHHSDYTDVLEAKTRPEQTDIIDCDTFVGDDEGNWLIAPEADETITLNTQVEKQAVVVRGQADVTIQGKGGIGGTASLNKAGSGTLTLLTQNTYTGATVLHGGELRFNTIANGGQPSALGASQEFAQNWVMDGGAYVYTGPDATTNRSARLLSDTELSIDHATLTLQDGTNATAFEGEGNLIINGDGQLNVAARNLFQFQGDLVLRGSTIHLSTTEIAKQGIGKARRLVMQGGALSTKGETAGYETYSFPIYVPDGGERIPVFAPFRNCYIDCAVTGTGTLQLDIPYLREYIRGNWQGFHGRLIANGVNSKNSEGSLLLLNSASTDLPSNAVTLKGNARLCAWATNGTFEVGGLSGARGTYLMGSSKNTKNFQCTWQVGMANTDEQFDGIINNWDCSGTDRGGIVSIEKRGSGVWRLTGTNTYRGTTTVSGGTLVVNGTHDGTGAITVKSGATLAGEGTLAGRVTVQKGAILHAGDTLMKAKTFNLGGGLVLQQGATVEIPLAVSGGFAQCNKVKVKGSFNVGGAVLSLDITEAQQIPSGKAFTVFNLSEATVSGTGFATIEPERPSPTQVWDTSELLTTGRLYVRDAESAAVGNIHVDKKAEAPTYNIGGMATQTTIPGIYIQNGKKKVIFK
ncbi:MAG: autotransporter-associated beta strand repeat-containing protein [Prevotella sp.]|nr:autotransporter-associated beta strand repeat-containing protein [Prevotella sp.]